MGAMRQPRVLRARLMADKDIALALAMLIEGFRVKEPLSEVSVRLYQRALADVPLQLLQPMVERCVATRKWFPKVAEVLEDAEAVRKEALQRMGTYGCEMCLDNKGWNATKDTDGVIRMRRCACKLAFDAKMAQIVGVGCLALPSGEESE